MSVTEAIAEQCAKTSKADFSSKAAREKTFKNAAGCAADATCAYMSSGTVPPGVCSKMVGPVVDFAVNAWNSVFGNEDEWKKYYEQRARTAQYFLNLGQVDNADAAQRVALGEVLARVIAYHDMVLGEDKGAWGVVSGPNQYFTKGAGDALVRAGAAIQPWPDPQGDPKFYSWRPKDTLRLIADDLETQAEVAALAANKYNLNLSTTAGRNEILAKARAAALSKFASQTAPAVVNAFLANLRAAADRVATSVQAERAARTAKAIKKEDVARMVSEQKALYAAAAEGRKKMLLATALVLTAGGGAAYYVYRKRKGRHARA